AGRYLDARVDPESLDVQVQESGGDWRHAEQLSHGTAEQIYLLLRTTLAQHLVRPEERAPLVLDDVTVQFDRDRKCATLDWLQSLAPERQVLLFTQEAAVLEWASARLVPARDALVRLEPAPFAR